MCQYLYSVVLKNVKRKILEKNVDYFLLISSPASLWFMLSSLPQLYNILYYICHVLPFNVMQFCAIMEYGHTYRYYIYIHGKISSIGINHTHILIHMYTFRKLLLLLLSTRNIEKRFMYRYFEVWNFGTRQMHGF